MATDRATRPISLTVVILTRDEHRHIERCIASVAGVASRVVIVDSGSTDDTRAIAAREGAAVFSNPWINYARQFNWALANAGIDTRWTMRLDADEIVLPNLRDQLLRLGDDDAQLAALTVNRRIHFLGRWIRWGGIYPSQVLRIWRTGHGRCEDRWMDEHILVDGPVRHIDGDIADINLNNIGWWTEKHNRYATREAIDELMEVDSAVDAPAGDMGRQARFKRWLKQHLYARLPLGLRAFGYFLYRYLVRLGLLDGWQGLAFHGLQGFWYRFLVDAKIAELRALMAQRGQGLAEVVAAEYDLDIKPNSRVVERNGIEPLTSTMPS